MKKITKLLILFLCLSNIVKAQDFAPSQQAQGLLESKNVTVDYSTGIFHYKVPVYTLKSGDFELPITLDYTGKGVKVDDKPGLLGYNWTLNMGGVVTRTVRGGIADESGNGYLRMEEYTGTPLVNDAAKVNLHKRDGECDIFTAVFNGQSVNFIIREDNNHKIYAESLEQTHVRIECIEREYPALEDRIRGWVITDDGGNRYTYMQREWFSKVNRENDNSFNSIRDENYISSWYLSKIEPVNEPPIYYSYEAGVKCDTVGEQHINKTELTYMYKSRYEYGRAMYERPFDFSKYENKFNEHIKYAQTYLDDAIFQTEMKSIINRMLAFSSYSYLPSYMQELDNMYRVNGFLSNLGEVSGASDALYNYLVDMSYLCPDYSVSMHLQMAAELIGQCMREENWISTRTFCNAISYEIRSPFLKSIRSADKILKFEYSDQYRNRAVLSAISVCNIKEDKISTMSMESTPYGTLQSIRVLGKDNKETQRLRFDYYSTQSEYTGADVWGYYKAIDPEMDEENIWYIMDRIDSVEVKNFSLKSVVSSYGGKITIDYSSNQLAYTHPVQSTNSTLSTHGGIRVRSLVLENESRKDTIRYGYPTGGWLIFERCGNDEYVEYKDTPSFSDFVLSSQMKFFGHSIVDVGNNGIYYPFVTEEINGNGTTAYLFYVPRDCDLVNPFWLNALPLATARYDADKHLKSIVKNRYLVDPLTYRDVRDLASYYSDYFTSDDRLSDNRQELPQIQAYDPYLDAEEMEIYYNDVDRFSRTLYERNIKPRTKVVLPQQIYPLYYGVKTLLKEQAEYRSESMYADKISFSRILNSRDVSLYKKTSYGYGNLPHSLCPTHVDMEDSQHNTITQITYRVIDMPDSVDDVIPFMKEKNMYTCPVKAANLKNGLLLNEEIISYQKMEKDNICAFVPVSRKVFYPSSPIIYDNLLSANTLYTYASSLYVPEESRKHVLGGSGLSFRVVESESRGNRKVLRNNLFGNQTLITVDNAKDEFVDVRDIHEMNSISRGGSCVGQFERIHKSFIRFYNAYLQIEPESEPMLPVGEEYESIVEFIKLMAERNIDTDYNDVLVLLEEINENVSVFNTFMDNCLLVFRKDTELISDLSQVGGVMISYDVYLSADYFLGEGYGTMYQFIHNALDKNSIKISSIPESKKMKLYVLLKNVSQNISCSITHSGGTAYMSFTPQYSSGYSVQAFDIDLSNYDSVTSIGVYGGIVGVEFLLFVPSGSSFQAVMHNLDDSVFAQFDETGALELYEYDAAGRLIRITNERGEIVKTQNYHVVNN